MTLPSQSQFDSALTKTDLAEIFKCRKIRTTGALLRIRSSREGRCGWDNVILYGQYVLDRARVR